IVLIFCDMIFDMHSFMGHHHEGFVFVKIRQLFSALDECIFTLAVGLMIRAGVNFLYIEHEYLFEMNSHLNHACMSPVFKTLADYKSVHDGSLLNHHHQTRVLLIWRISIIQI
ncbi:hypothetical protein ACJX0J_024580, partial [Zea mays]